MGAALIICVAVGTWNVIVVVTVVRDRFCVGCGSVYGTWRLKVYDSTIEQVV